MKNRNFFWGALLVIIGVMALCNNVLETNMFDAASIWPCFILIPGLAFEVGYFTNRRNPGVLVPGGILTTIGILFLFENVTNWRFAHITWPVYPLAVAIGLFQLYLFDGRNRGILVPVTILTSVSVIGFISMIYGDIWNFVSASVLGPALLIIFGGWILYKGSAKGK